MPALHLASFTADITPPAGHPLCGGWIEPVRGVDDPLEIVGVVLLGMGSPIVLAAIVLAAAAGALLRRRYRRPRGSPRPSVRAEPHPDSPGTVRLRVTGPDVRGTVRIEPHQSYVYSRLERAQP